MEKAGAPTDNVDLVRKDDFKRSKFATAVWPRLKPQMTSIKLELQKVKIDMLIALGTYRWHVGSQTMGNETATEGLAPLWRKKVATERELAETHTTTNLAVSLTGIPAPNFSASSVARSLFKEAPSSTLESVYASGPADRPSLEGNRSSSQGRGKTTVSSEDSHIERVHRAPGIHGDTRNQAHYPPPAEQPAGVEELNPIFGSKRELMITPANPEISATSDPTTPYAPPASFIIVEQVFRAAIVAHKFNDTAMNVLGLSTLELPEELRDPTQANGYAELKSIRYERQDDGTLYARESEYPLHLLCKRVVTRRKLQPFTLAAYSAIDLDVAGLPWTCRQSIVRITQKTIGVKNIWRTVTVDAVFRTPRGQPHGDTARSGKVDDFICAEVVFKMCAHEPPAALPQDTNSKTWSAINLDAASTMGANEAGHPKADIKTPARGVLETVAVVCLSCLTCGSYHPPRRLRRPEPPNLLEPRYLVTGPSNVGLSRAEYRTYCYGPTAPLAGARQDPWAPHPFSIAAQSYGPTTTIQEAEEMSRVEDDIDENVTDEELQAQILMLYTSGIGGQT